MKPMLASDAVEAKIEFPCIIQPKIDGVRGLNLTGTLTGRSLKQHKNTRVTRNFSKREYLGLDGELAAQDKIYPHLCRLTSSVLSTINSVDYVMWHVFDYINEHTSALPYKYRLTMLNTYLYEEQQEGRCLDAVLIESVWCDTLEQLLAQEQVWLDTGYEGIIVRDPEGLYKQGRSTVREGGLLRIKRFVEEEAEVLSIIEGVTNSNTQQVNELGLAFRSSHQENMIPNGMVGAMICRNLKDGKEIKVGAGCMTDIEAAKYFKSPELLVGYIIKYKHFPKGVKDKPRFPTYQSHKIESDIGVTE